VEFKILELVEAIETYTFLFLVLVVVFATSNGDESRRPLEFLIGPP
jgi:hypothetical protein